MNDKNFYRKKCKLTRAVLDSSDCSKKIVEIIQKWDVFIQAKNVMLFYPFNNEISLLDLIDDHSKSFYFPTITDELMCPVKYDKNKGFCIGKYGIKEPVGDRINDFSILNLIFVPALGADSSGFRIGYGKGYYDRFLKKINNACVKAIPIHSNLVFTSLPNEPHDIACDFIITEKQILNIINRS